MRPCFFKWASVLVLVWGTSSYAAAQTADALGDPASEPVPDGPEIDLDLPMPPHLVLDSARLGAFFETEANSERDAMIVANAFLIGGGAANLGLGLWLMLDDATFAGFDTVRATAGGLGVTFGLMSLITGIYGLTTIGFAQDRDRRWRAALAGGLDERSLGRFEGELRSEAEIARVLRTFNVASGFAQAAGGLGLVIATAISPLDEAGQISGYSLGGLFSLIGLITAFDSLFSVSREETNWRMYQEGRGPDDEEGGVDLSVAPTVFEGGGGFQLQGTF